MAGDEGGRDAGMIDLHSHILPGLDDGARDMDEALRMCSIAAEDGITHIVATPHNLNGVYTNSKEAILDAVASLNNALKQHAINITVLPGSDVYLDAALIDEMNKGTIMTLNNGGRFLLLELPGFFVPAHIREQVFKLKLMGITPVISHPERNDTAMENPKFLYDLINAGALLQVTAGSVTGDFGSSVLKNVRRLLARGMAHIVATDTHNTSSRPPRLSEAVKALSDSEGPEEARMLVMDRPESIIKGDMPAVRKPLKAKRKRTLLSLLGFKRH